ncbi:MAG: class II glutamine amidotransferase [Oscillospiraceae bacterium]|nr:class II glutamine amidotransferase [Oscillospiraceae bacterium]
MCCLFGIYDYAGQLTRKQKSKILSALSIAAEERGTDATGIAYNADDSLKIYKRPLPAHLMWFKVPESSKVVMGHTRMTTQGSERFNANNHPFPGKVGETNFALAHNGVLTNDKLLRRELNLPATRIETDSYIAVQILETASEVSFATLADMTELLQGSFSITVMTDKDELYFIRGNNPLCLMHFERLGVIMYASTEEILRSALRQIPVKLGRATKIRIDSGEILKIDAEGRITRGQFNDSKLFTSSYRPWGSWFFSEPSWCRSTSDETSYLDDLKAVAAMHGIWPEDVDAMLADGATVDDIEELIYGC